MSGQPELNHKAEDERQSSHHRWLAAAAIMLGAFLALAGINITTTASELLQNRFGLTLDQLTLVTSGYIIAEVAAMPFLPLLLRRFGLYRVAVCAISGFVLAALGCAVVDDADALIGCRILQGACGGLLLPLVHTSIRWLLPVTDHARAFGFFSVFAALAPVVGPSYAGWLNPGLYPWLFLWNLPLGLLVLLGLAKSLAQWPALARQPDSTTSWGFDISSGLVFAGAFASLVYVLEFGFALGWWQDGSIRAATVFGLVLLGYGCCSQLGSATPVLNIRLLGEAGFGWVCLASFLIGIVIYGFVFLIPYLLIAVKNYSPAEVAGVVLITAVPQLLSLPLMVRLAPRIPPNLAIVAGALMAAVGCWLCATLSPDMVAAQLTVPQLLRVLAVPLLVMPLTLLSLRLVSSQDAASAAILFNVARNLGGAVGVAGLITFVEWQQQYLLQQSLLGLTERLLFDLQMAPAPLALRQPEYAELATQLAAATLLQAFCQAFLLLFYILLAMALWFAGLHWLQAARLPGLKRSSP